MERGWMELGEGFGRAQMDPDPAAARVGEAGSVLGGKTWNGVKKTNKTNKKNPK